MRWHGGRLAPFSFFLSVQRELTARVAEVERLERAFQQRTAGKPLMTAGNLPARPLALRPAKRSSSAPGRRDGQQPSASGVAAGKAALDKKREHMEVMTPRDDTLSEQGSEGGGGSGTAVDSDIDVVIPHPIASIASGGDGGSGAVLVPNDVPPLSMDAIRMDDNSPLPASDPYKTPEGSLAQSARVAEEGQRGSVLIESPTPPRPHKPCAPAMWQQQQEGGKGEEGHGAAAVQQPDQFVVGESVSSPTPPPVFQGRRSHMSAASPGVDSLTYSESPPFVPPGGSRLAIVQHDQEEGEEQRHDEGPEGIEEDGFRSPVANSSPGEWSLSSSPLVSFKTKRGSGGADGADDAAAAGDDENGLAVEGEADEGAGGHGEEGHEGRVEEGTN